MKKLYLLIAFLLSGVFYIIPLKAQILPGFTLTGQLRTRTEYRDGQGTLPLRGVTPSVFTSQRTRLSAGYNSYRFRVLTTIQDVRVWGQDGTTISNSDGNKLYLHEAWGELILNDSTWHDHKLSLKIGRQEIVYDDSKLLGNLDWLQQARRHDAAILKYLKGTLQVDIGVAFNQDREKKNAGNLYVGVPAPQLGNDSVATSAAAGTNAIGRMYKSMQYLYAAKEVGLSKITFLFFKDDFQKLKNPAGALNSEANLTKGVYSRVTTGINIFAVLFRKHKLDMGAFYQGNQDKVGKTMDGYMLSFYPQFAVGRKFTVGPGVDFLSGNNTNKSFSVDRRFDPLYGTPHKFWGFMDYFYVADGYGLGSNNAQSPGLLNYYLKTRYKIRDNLTATLDFHEFFAGNEVANTETITDATDKLNRRLGTEIDFVLQYAFTREITIESGYSLMLGTSTLARLKSTNPAVRENANWAYLMISIRPNFLFTRPAPPPALPDAIRMK
jgi:hypothetical protein